MKELYLVIVVELLFNFLEGFLHRLATLFNNLRSGATKISLLELAELVRSNRGNAVYLFRICESSEFEIISLWIFLMLFNFQSFVDLCEVLTSLLFHFIVP